MLVNVNTNNRNKNKQKFFGGSPVTGGLVEQPRNIGTLRINRIMK